MKRVPKPVFFVVALLILAFSFTAIFGISYYTLLIYYSQFRRKLQSVPARL